MPSAPPASAPRFARSRRGTFAMAALIFLATAIAYLPALRSDFLWNDSDYVTAPALRPVAGLARIWGEVGATEQYYPLLHSAFWLEHRLWGGHAPGYHAITLLLHAGSAVLFALVLRRLTVPGAWLAGLLFALHPVHVESVAWIAEQKNTLSLVFYLLAARAYLQFDETRRGADYAVALAWFLAALASKTVTTTLPAALLVVLWWKRGTLDWRRDWRPLLAWLVLGALAGLGSSWVERASGAEGAALDLPLAGRVLVAGRAVWFYLGQLAWPADLNFIYPRWTPDVRSVGQWFFPIGVVALGGALWAIRGRSRAPLAAYLFFVGSLFPVLGFVNLYGAFFSWVWDHWQYLPDLGPLAFAAAGLARAGQAVATRGRWIAPAAVVALAGGLGTLTWRHCGMFRDVETLYRTTLAKNPDAWMAHNNLGNLLATQPGRLAEAIGHFETARRLNPDFAHAYFNLGTALQQVPERAGEAVALFETAVRLDPKFVKAHGALGAAWMDHPERLADAIRELETAVRLNPASVVDQNNLGLALLRAGGREGEAIRHLETARRLDPTFGPAYVNLGIALAQRPGRLPEAIAFFEKALSLDANFAEARYLLGLALAQDPARSSEAAAQFEAVLRLNPGFAPARQALERLRGAAGP